MELLCHGKALRLLSLEARSSPKARKALDDIERTTNQKLPPAVREWYELEGAVGILAKYSNDDHPVPIDELAQSLTDAERNLRDLIKQKFLVIKHENQGVCTWAVLLDGSADPPVFLDFDSRFDSPIRCADSFSHYVFSCVWDYSQVLAADSLLLQAQNSPLSEAALSFLSSNFDEECVTYGWPGERQYRFHKGNQRVLVWADSAQADWWVHAETAESLESLVRLVGPLDSVGKALWSNDAQGQFVLQRTRETTT